MKIILQKYIAQSGHCSRRHAERLIRETRVKLNGKPAKIGDTIDLDNLPVIHIDGKPLRLPEAKIYIKLNKPSGFTSTTRKFKGERNVFDLVRVPQRLFIVGRLDKDSRGLTLLTNDGELTDKLTHPRYEKEKEYQAIVSGQKLDPKKIVEQFTEGIDIGEEDGIAWAKKTKHLGGDRFSIILTQGKKRQIRRMFKVLGLTVKDLVRVRIGQLELGSLKEGQWKKLTDDEIKKLK